MTFTDGSANGALGPVMGKKVMSTDEQIAKLTEVTRMAKEAADSDDIVRRIGAVTLYAGLVDFYTIQAARLMEQVILKAQLAAGEEPKFTPRPDSYFYDNRVDTRRMINIIKNDLLPFRPVSSNSAVDADQANVLAEALIAKTNKFLNYRITIIHHLGSPKMTLEKLSVLCEKAILAYEDFQRAHTAFFEAVQPYRFGDKELLYFYGTHEHWTFWRNVTLSPS